ncbi:hypothetical protein [Pseudophaeobacter sp.]|uniref:hypothetical protein n=1 Tax=Pseudophaeobacter sp. TaxID=1971739 RepID=UPI004058837F
MWFWILRHLPGLSAAAALVAMACWLGAVIGERARLQADLAATTTRLHRAQSELERAAEAARIHRAHLARAADEARRWSVLSNELQQMEGRDAPLSSLLSATAERLYATTP